MNVVLVQHNDARLKKYCFVVPDKLVPHIDLGTKVICDTQRGRVPGIIVSSVMTGEEAYRTIESEHATFPLRSVVSIIKEIDIENIKVPVWMERSTPNKDKIRHRKQEIRLLGGVKTKVKINDGVLKDGYTAYLVCRNAGMSVIPVVVDYVQEIGKE